MKNQQQWLVFAGIVFICATIAFSVVRLERTGITIQNSGTTSGKIQNSISVSGEGKITTVPDLVKIDAGVSEIADTTKEAQDKANDKLDTIISILAKNDVPERNIKTSNLSFFPEYDWKGEDGRKLVGQRVRQTLTIKIPEIDENPERVTDILDALGSINGLVLNSVNFDIEDKKDLFSEAREKAFEKAHQKAKELAKFGDVELGKPITISEASVRYNPMPYRNFAMAEVAMDGGGGSSLPSGELDVMATVNVVFQIR